MATATTPRTDSTPQVVRVAVIHAAVVAVVAAIFLVILAAVFRSIVLVLLALVVAAAIGAAVTAWRIRGLDERLAGLFGARRLAVGDEPRLDTVVDAVSMATGIEPPIMHVIDSDAVNTIAWGVGPGPVNVAVTSGLLSNLDRVELEGVMAQTAAAIDARPTDAVTLAAGLFGGAKPAVADRVARLVNGPVDPDVVTRCDVAGAIATRYPPGLVSALEKVAASSTAVASIPAAFSALCFAAPVADPGPFAVHPPISDRIDLMREW